MCVSILVLKSCCLRSWKLQEPGKRQMVLSTSAWCPASARLLEMSGLWARGGRACPLERLSCKAGLSVGGLWPTHTVPLLRLAGLGVFPLPSTEKFVSDHPGRLPVALSELDTQAPVGTTCHGSSRLHPLWATQAPFCIHPRLPFICQHCLLSVHWPVTMLGPFRSCRGHLSFLSYNAEG